MQDIANSVDKFLTFNEYKILSDLGKISRKVADKKVREEYKQFNKQQKIKSDFEKQIKQSLNSVNTNPTSKDGR